jgi:hypothetical protein
MTMPNNNVTFVVASFAVTWIGLLGYAIRVHVALSRARAEHDAAMSSLERAQ